MPRNPAPDDASGAHFVPFRTDPGWYEAHWLREAPAAGPGLPARATALAFEALAASAAALARASGRFSEALRAPRRRQRAA